MEPRQAVVTVTLNASLDVAWTIERLARGGITYVERSRAVAGGKGNNVARVLATLGVPVIASGLSGGATGARITADLRATGIEPVFVETGVESRTCLTLIESGFGETTEVRERGEPVSVDAVNHLEDVLLGIVSTRDIAAVGFSGSLPPGIAPDTYARLAEACARHVPLVALDSSGDALAHGLNASVGLLSPNALELASLMGSGEEAALDELIEFSQAELLGRLAATGRILLSRGRAGACLITSNDVLIAHPPVLQPVSPVGCGDALLAGYIAAQGCGASAADALRHAVATGSAAALQDAPGVVDVNDVHSLLTEINVEPYVA